ncbi:MAG: HD domain-containing protein [Fimbriimonadaceae bacterium]
MSPELTDRLAGLAAERRALLKRLQTHPSGMDWCRDHAALVDRTIRLVYEEAVGEAPGAPRISVVAVGGYGRAELSPYSDADIAVIPEDDAHPGLDDSVRRLYRMLHDAFGRGFALPLSYAFCLINDAPALDPKSRTAFLDARLVAGPFQPFAEFQALFRDSFPTGEFLIEKRSERRRAWAEHGDTPYLTEPNLKESAGGLRCFQTANWLRTAIGLTPVRPTPEYDAVLRIRNLLHLVAEKGVDRFSRQRQAEVADLLGTTPTEISGDGARAMRTLHNAYLEAEQAVYESRFPIFPGVVSVRGEARVLAEASLSEAAVGIALATRLGLKIEPATATPTDRIVGPEALYAIVQGEATLRNLDRCGLLDRLLPELARCRCLMPEDPTHTYSVFEHTLRVVRFLFDLPPHPIFAEVQSGLSGNEELVLAALLHDVGKVDETRPHSESGADMAREIGNRWGLAASTVDDVEWLVREHLTMALFSRTRDVEHPQTAIDLAERVGERKRLDLLLLLTQADIRAVSDSAWSLMQENLLAELYQRTRAVLEGDRAAEVDPALYRRRLRRELSGEDFPEDVIRGFLESMPAHYIVSTPPETVREHLGYVRRARAGEPTIDLVDRREIQTTEITVCCPDAPGLLSRILGVLYAWDLSLLGVRASTSSGEFPTALDTFTVSFNNGCLPPATAGQVAETLRQVLLGEADVNDILRRRGKDPDRTQESYSYRFLAGYPGILEIRAPRGRGLAFRMSRLIADKGWNIVAARLGQWGGRGTATFYVLGPNDEPLIEDAVRAALAAPTTGAP